MKKYRMNLSTSDILVPASLVGVLVDAFEHCSAVQYTSEFSELENESRYYKETEESIVVTIDTKEVDGVISKAAARSYEADMKREAEIPTIAEAAESAATPEDKEV